MPPARSSLPGDVSTVLVAVGAGLWLTAVITAAANAPADAAFGRALLEALIVGIPSAAGIWAIRSPATRNLGIAMLVIGFGWSLTALAASSLSVPYTIGRLATWVIVPAGFYLLLAVPDGHIARGLDRALMAGVAAVALVLYYGTAPLITDFPPHTLWATCTTDCPNNALSVVDHEPAFLAAVVSVREWLVDLLWIGTLVSMARRWRAASRLQRLVLEPVFVLGAVMGLTQIAFYTARELGAPANTVIALSSVCTLSLVGIVVGLMFGLMRRQMLLAQALARLGIALRYSDDPTQMRDALAAALSDSSMQVLFRDGVAAGWHDARGRAIDLSMTGADRAATTISSRDGRHDLMLVHDAALRDDRELLDGVSSMVVAGWRHERVMADLGQAMTDLEESRRRISTAADHERARIERDLHDGAQQRLISLRIRLGLAEEILRTNPDSGIQQVHELGFEAERALEELRSLAHGLYPPVLMDAGLVDALKAVARDCGTPVHVVAAGVTRQPMEVETAIYFTCAEALQNAIKHAASASAVRITLRQNAAVLRFEVADDGVGFCVERAEADALHRTGASGLGNMHDRIEAIGGTLTVDSAPGNGTRVRGVVSVA